MYFVFMQKMNKNIDRYWGAEQCEIQLLNILLLALNNCLSSVVLCAITNSNIPLNILLSVLFSKTKKGEQMPPLRCKLAVVPTWGMRVWPPILRERLPSGIVQCSTHNFVAAGRREAADSRHLEASVLPLSTSGTVVYIARSSAQTLPRTNLFEGLFNCLK